MAETKVIPYSIPESILQVDTSFILSTNIDELEAGIMKIGHAQDILSLAQGVAMVKIENEEIWRQAGFPNLRAYRIAQGKRLNMKKTTISLRRRAALVWLKYRKQLAKVNLTGKVSFLLFFDEGVARHGLKETVAALKKMTIRQFQAWAAPEITAEEMGLPAVELSIRSGDIVIEGTTVARFADEIKDDEREFLAYLIREGYSSKKAGMQAHVVSVVDDAMAKAIDDYAKKYLAN